MKCSNCGIELSEDSKICHRCGARQSASARNLKKSQNINLNTQSKKENINKIVLKQ